MEVKDIMTKDVVSVMLDTPVNEIAKRLVEHDIKGVPVVNNAGEVAGLITEADLILQNAKLHIPTFIKILDGVFVFGEKETEEELRRITGTVAEEIMSKPAICVHPDTSVEDLATLMWEKKINPVPVTQDNKLVGIVSRADIVKLLR